LSDVSRQRHWENVYTIKGENELSWFQENPFSSLELMARVGATSDTAVIDVGGGASRLVDHLLETGFRTVTVLDLSETALAAAKARLGSRANQVEWIVADITTWEPQQVYDLWRDRATFHFLTDEHDRKAYVACLTKAVKPGGHAIMPPLRRMALNGAAASQSCAKMPKAPAGRSGAPSSLSKLAATNI
jgi:trans-aconitate methyltransferase